MQSIKTGMQATSWGASVRFWLGSVLNESLNSVVSHPVTPPSLLLLFHSAQVTVIPCVNCGASKQKRSFAASPWEDHRDPRGSWGTPGSILVAYHGIPGETTATIPCHARANSVGLQLSGSFIVAPARLACPHPPLQRHPRPGHHLSSASETKPYVRHSKNIIKNHKDKEWQGCK